MLLITLVVVCSVVLDQLVKYWAVASLAPVGTIPLIPGLIGLAYTENTGAAFSLLSGARWLFLPLTVVLVGVMIWALWKGYFRNLFGRLAIAFIMGGAIGNFIDRLLHGYVVDMFEFQFIRFAIFNVADIFITVGGVMFVIYFLFMDDKLKLAEERAHEKPDA